MGKRDKKWPPKWGFILFYSQILSFNFPKNCREFILIGFVQRCERLYYPVFFSNPISAKILVLELLCKILLSVIVSDCRILSSAMAQKRIELCFVCSSVFMETRNLYLINWVLWFLPCFTVCLSFGLSDCSFLETTH